MADKNNSNFIWIFLKTFGKNYVLSWIDFSLMSLAIILIANLNLHVIDFCCRLFNEYGNNLLHFCSKVIYVSQDFDNTVWIQNQF